MSVHSVVESRRKKSPRTVSPRKTRSSRSVAVAQKLPHECRVCDERFAVESALTAHLYAHIESSSWSLESIEAPNVMSAKLFDCSHCSAQFKSAGELTGHLNEHGDPRPHTCWCGRRLRTANQLTRHRLLHDRKDRVSGRTVAVAAGKVYQCPQCEKRFASQTKLTHHLRTHSSDRPFQCPQVLLNAVFAGT